MNWKRLKNREVSAGSRRWRLSRRRDFSLNQLLFTSCCSWSIKIIPLNTNIALFSSHFCLNVGRELISWDHTQCGGMAAPCCYSVGMKISAAKKGLHHRDVALSLCEKGQQFKQEIRHHNPIKSEDYHRAPTFFTWSLTNVFDQDVCSCTTDTLFNIILTIYIQIWIIKLFSSTKVMLSRTTIKSIPAVWVLFCRFLMSETNWTT